MDYVKSAIKAFTLAALFVISGISGCGEKTPPDPVGELLTGLIEEYGGEEALKGFSTSLVRWDIEAIARGDKGEDVRYLELPDRLRVELNYTTSGELRVINGEEGLKGFKDSQGRVTMGPALGPPLLGMKLQRMRLHTPLMLMKKKAFLTVSEKDGFKVITLVDGPLTANYYVNPGKRRIEVFVGKLDMGGMGGRTIEFKTEYSDFKMVSGLLMHHREVKYAGGTNTAVLALKELRLGEKHDPRLFNVK